MLPLLALKDRGTWSEIKTFLDDYHEKMAFNLLKNENSPLEKSGEDLVLKDWALKKLDQISGVVRKKKGVEKQKDKDKAKNVPSSSENVPSSSENVPSSSENVPSSSENVPSSSENVPSDIILIV